MSGKNLRQGKLFRGSLLKKKRDSHVFYTNHHIENIASSCVIQRSNYIIASSDFIILNYNQIEACRKIIARRIRRLRPKGTYLNPLKFTLPFTSKSKNSRMGKGKGSVSHFVTRVKAFDTLFVLRNSTHACAARILLKVGHKLPMGVCLLVKSTRSYKLLSVLSNVR
jgi:ribosomal protein L16/L10AE